MSTQISPHLQILTYRYVYACLRWDSTTFSLQNHHWSKTDLAGQQLKVERKVCWTMKAICQLLRFVTMSKKFFFILYVFVHRYTLLQQNKSNEGIETIYTDFVRPTYNCFFVYWQKVTSLLNLTHLFIWDKYDIPCSYFFLDRNRLKENFYSVCNDQTW